MVELNGQRDDLNQLILDGFSRLQKIISQLLKNAALEGDLRSNTDYEPVASQILIWVIGAATLFSVQKNIKLLEDCLDQIRHYLDSYAA